MTIAFADSFAQLDRSVREFRRTRERLAADGVSWIMADRQLQALIQQNPARAREILSRLEGAPVAGGPPAPLGLSA